jgi:hypothetical protein
MYTLQGKPDQHAICILRSVRVWPSIICISHSPRTTTFYVVVNRVEQIHCRQEEGLPSQSISWWLTDPWVRTQHLSHNRYWSSGEKSSVCCLQATRLTRLIPPVCDQYIQYLLAGANSSVLNQHRRGIQPWRCRLSTALSLPIPTDGAPLST